MKGPTPRPFLKAFIFAAIAFAILLSLALSALGHQAGDQTGNAVGYLVGWFGGFTALAALITGFFARRAKTAWSTTKIGVIYIVVLLIVGLVIMIGRLPPRT